MQPGVSSCYFFLPLSDGAVDEYYKYTSSFSIFSVLWVSG
jgi:hypothetical protein